MYIKGGNEALAEQNFPWYNNPLLARWTILVKDC